MNTIKLICKGCSHIYFLGQNAIVASGPNLIDDLSLLGGVVASTGLLPDQIIERSWHTLSEKEKHEQAKRMALIEKGRKKQWVCQKCNVTQNY